MKSVSQKRPTPGPSLWQAPSPFTPWTLPGACGIQHFCPGSPVRLVPLSLCPPPPCCSSHPSASYDVPRDVLFCRRLSLQPMASSTPNPSPGATDWMPSSPWALFPVPSFWPQSWALPASSHYYPLLCCCQTAAPPGVPRPGHHRMETCSTPQTLKTGEQHFLRQTVRGQQEPGIETPPDKGRQASGNGLSLTEKQFSAPPAPRPAEHPLPEEGPRLLTKYRRNHSCQTAELQGGERRKKSISPCYTLVLTKTPPVRTLVWDLV